MSLFDRRTVLFLIPAAVAACGFTPVYGPGGTGSALRDKVLVDAPQTRDAFLLVQDLEQRLGRGAQPRYGLSVGLNVTEEGLAVTAAGDITRFNLVGEATFALRDLDSGAVLASGKTRNFTGYSATGSTVETLTAERDARARLMRILADQIVARLLASPDLTAAT